MEQRLIKINELKAGDEVLIGSSDLKKIKLLRTPKIAKKPNWRGDIIYSSVKCLINKENTIVNWTNSSGQARQYSSVKCNIEGEYNKEIYVDLNYRNIWLINREYDGTDFD